MSTARGKKRSGSAGVSRVAPTWLIVTIVACAALAGTAWLFYPVAREQYIASRERDALAAELDAVNARNDRIQAEIDRLETPEGVEDYARSQLGWTKPGENAVVVTGVEGDSSIGIPPRVDSRSIEPTETVVSRLLDTIFAVE